MNKGTAIVGFFMSFLAGMFLMWGIDRSNGVEISAEGSSDASAVVDHGAALIPVTDKDPTWGNADAPVTIVEISDFQCPYCSRVGPTLKKVKEAYGPDKVRIVWKHYPLNFHKQARPAHIASAVVHDLNGNEAFWKYHDLLFANQRALTPENLQKWAVEVGVDVAKFKTAIKDKKYDDKLTEDMAMAGKIGVRGTPNFQVNGVALGGALPFPKFKEEIDKQLAEAKKLTDGGMKPAEVYPALVAKNATAKPKADQAKKKERPVDNTVWAVPVYDDDPVKGGKEPLVTIVEFSEFQCPFCSRVLPTVKKILDTYGDDVQVVWKDNPLGFHPRATPASSVAREVFKAKGDQAFWDVHDKLFANQKQLDDDSLLAAAKGSGVPEYLLKNALKSNPHADKFEQSQDLASDFQARGTPHFFINGIRLAGAQKFDKFKEVIDAQIAKAKAKVKKGTPRSKIYEELVMKEGKTPPPPPKKDVGQAPKDSPSKGAKNAKIVIQEFSDFQCPFCSRVNPQLAQVLKEFDGEVRVVWRNLPLGFHKDAPLAAEASFEVYKQKGDKAFWKYHDKLFANQKSPGGVKRANLEKFAEELEVDMAAFKKALDERTHKARVEVDAEAAKKAGITGTPGFVINGYYISGAQPFGAFKKAIKLAKKDL